MGQVLVCIVHEISRCVCSALLGLVGPSKIEKLPRNELPNLPSFPTSCFRWVYSIWTGEEFWISKTGIESLKKITTKYKYGKLADSLLYAWEAWWLQLEKRLCQVASVNQALNPVNNVSPADSIRFHFFFFSPCSPWLKICSVSEQSSPRPPSIEYFSSIPPIRKWSLRS